MTWPLEVLRDEVVWILVLGVGSFHLLVKAQKQTLLALLVMACFVAVSYMYLRQRAEEVTTAQKDTASFLDQEITWRKEAHSDRYFVATFPKKGLTYLRENPELMRIAKGIVVARMFDRARYADLLLLLDRLQKVYMYILDGRYAAKTHVPTFLDLRENVLEILYSLYFVIPSRIEHVYGLNPYRRIEETIERFSHHSRLMIQVLKSYSDKTAKEPSFPILMPSASDAPFDPLRNRRLP